MARTAPTAYCLPLVLYPSDEHAAGPVTSPVSVALFTLLDFNAPFAMQVPCSRGA